MLIPSNEDKHKRVLANIPGGEQRVRYRSNGLFILWLEVAAAVAGGVQIPLLLSSKVVNS